MTPEQIEKLRSYVEYYANCPCCDKSDECEDGCTFSGDDQVGHDVMVMAREALGGQK